MSAPLFKFGLFGADTGLVIAFIIGIGFGFFLERAGFGSARKLVSQFYLDDLAVFKVMFTAIVTAMLGVTYLSWLGVLDLSLIYLTPTYLVPQVIGGLVLGFGFVIGGYCPGTSVAAAATGKVDGLVFILGVLAGTLGFAEAYPLVRGVHLATPLGQTTIPQFFNLPYGMVVFAVLLVAVGGFVGASWVEKKMAARNGAEPARRDGKRALFNRRLATAALVLAAVAVFAQPRTGTIARVDARELAQAVQRGEGRIGPLQLADWIIKGTADFRLIDLRDEAPFAAYHIPGAENVRMAALLSSGIGPTDKIILYSDDGSEAAEAWVLLHGSGFKDAHVLTGGLNGWREAVLFPTLKVNATSAEQVNNARLAAISAHFGGAPRSQASGGGTWPAIVETTMPAPPVAVPTLPAGAAKSPVAKKKKEGC